MQRTIALVAAFVLLACAPPGQRTPPFVAMAEQPAPAHGPPAAEPQNWLLAFIDVETTGLVPGYHEMIDCGIVITDLDGVVRDSFFVRIIPQHPERISEGARQVNGFDEARWRTIGVPPAVAVDSLLRFHRRATAGKSVLLVALNSHFDTAFLDHLLRAGGYNWRELYHYFVLDIPSMAWALGLRDLTGGALARKLDVPDEPRVAADHTGLTGAQLNARLYRALLGLGQKDR